MRVRLEPGVELHNGELPLLEPDAAADTDASGDSADDADDDTADTEQ